MAASELSLDTDELEVLDGIVRYKSDRSVSISYAELTKEKQIMETSNGDVALKYPSEFRIMGSSRYRVDSYEKVRGSAKYAGGYKINLKIGTLSFK